MSVINKQFKSTYTYLKQWIMQCIPSILNNYFYSMQTKIYWIIHGLIDFPKCQNPACSNTFSNRNVSSILKGYPHHCSHVCAVNNPSVKEQAKNTCIERYGAVSPAQNENVKNKSKKTCLERYGVEYTFQSENNKNKSKITWQKNYGVDHPCKLAIISNKIKATKIEKYGDNDPWHSIESMEKRKITWQKNYGVDHPCKSDIIKQQIKNSSKEHYGVEHFSQSKESQFNRAKLSYAKILLTNEFDEPAFSLDEYANRINYKQLLDFKCKKCGNIFKTIHRDGFHHRCPLCYPIDRMSSNEEKDVVKFVKTLYTDIIIENTKSIISPKELDIYVPSKNIAIEFDGLYWHCDDNKLDKKYHLNKTELCEEKDIQLIHIFENEWIYKQDIVKSRLKNFLGIYDKTIFARKCEIKEIDSKTSKEFQEENHIQGSVNAKVNLGLYYDNDLISLMTFGKCRFDRKHEWELLRFCNKLGYHIPGAAGKLLKYFERNYKPKSLVSYADRRWSRGKLYEVLGFTFSHASEPNYWYFNSSFMLESRVKYQKHKLKDVLDKFDAELTEIENMKANGYHRIFDCGNLVYVKYYNV